VLNVCYFDQTNHTALNKMGFRLLRFPQVVQKQTFGEVET